MDPNTPTQIPPTQPITPLNKFLKLPKSVLISLLIALAVIIPATGYLLNKNQSNKQISTIQSSITPTPNLASSWKTYTKNGYSVKFPEDFTLTSKLYTAVGGQVQQDDWSNGEAKISIFSYQEGVDPIVSILIPTKPEEKILVANQTVSKLMPASGQPLIHVGPIKNGSKNFKIVYVFPSTSINKLNYDEFSQILSTFRFTDR